MKKLFTLFALMLVCIGQASAYDFEVDGIYYNFDNWGDKEVSVTYNDYGFYSGSIAIPNSVTYSGKTYSVTSIGEYAFYDCSGLNSVTIPNSVDCIYGEAFAGSGLTSINIPNCVDEIHEKAFAECHDLISATLSNNLTGIDRGLFFNCNKLTSIIIPEGVTRIRGGAFYGCSSLKTITCLPIIPPTCTEEDGYNVFLANCYNTAQVYVPNTGSALARYLGNNVWGQFRYIFEKDLTGVDTPIMNNEAQVSGLINLNGQYISDAQRGIMLQKMNDGTVKKVLLR